MNKKSVLLLLLLATSGFLSLVANAPTVHATTTIELSVLSGSTVCQSDLMGVWDASVNDCRIYHYDITIQSGTALLIDSGVKLESNHTILNQGELNNSGILGVGACYCNTATPGPGTINNVGKLNNAGTLNDGPGGTITSSGTIDSSGQVNIDGTFTNSGTIVSSGGFGLNSDGSITNTGMFTTSGTNTTGLHVGGLLSNSGSLDDQGDISTGSGTIINNQVGGTVKIEGGANLFRPYQDTNPGTAIINNYGIINDSGTLTVRNRTTLNNENGGSIYVSSAGYLEGNDTVNNYGSLDSHGLVCLKSSDVFSNQGTFNNYGHTCNSGTLDNAANFNNYGSTGNSGTLNNAAAATINNPGTIFNSCAGVINNSGMITGNPVVFEACQSTQQGSASVSAGSVPTQTFSTTGLAVSVSGTTGTSVQISTAQLTAQPTHTGGLSLSPAGGVAVGFYDLSLSGIAGGTAHVCISRSNIDATTVIDYFTAGSWTQAAMITVTPGTVVCGDVPVSALGGTPLAVGDPPTTVTTTTTATTTTLSLTTTATTTATTTLPASTSTATSTLTVLTSIVGPTVTATSTTTEAVSSVPTWAYGAMAALLIVGVLVGYAARRLGSSRT
jgi:hypothetical protein